MKHCNLKAIYSLIYQVNTSVCKTANKKLMVEENNDGRLQTAHILSFHLRTPQRNLS